MRTAAFLDNACHGQDRILRTRRVLAVLDGVSESDGARAAETVARALSSGEDVPGAVRAAHEELRGTGALTTCVAVDLVRRRVYNVGDSLAFFVGEGIEALTPADRDAAEPNVVTQALGSGDVILHEAALPAKEGLLLLMSDGVSDNLAPEHLLACCRGTREPRTVVQRIMRMLARRRREEQGYAYADFKEDDQALVVLQL